MSHPEFSTESAVWMSQLSDHLKQHRYGTHAPDYLAKAKYFLNYLPSRNLTIHTVKPSDIEKYLGALRPKRRSARMDPSLQGLRIPHRAAIHMLLRLVHGRWPLAPTPKSRLERFRADLIGEYDAWMRDLRGLSAGTRVIRCTEARIFLEWVAGHGRPKQLAHITVADVDAYVQSRASSMRRQSLQGFTSNLRIFLRHLHDSGKIPDLSSTLIGPRLYAFEGIPSTLRAEDIDKVLHCTRKDRSPVGLRDYALLLLLSTYGLRAGEVSALRFEDIDWTHDRLRVRHFKTGAFSELPLLREPGEAILKYLRRGRPKTSGRELFVLAKAPYSAVDSGVLYSALQRRLKVAGVTPHGRKGPHTFRHARAASLLKCDTPLKVIADVLGHRSLRSTMTYLKLDQEALRGVGLELPGAAP
jgi:integrase/recombinase XerD